MCNHKYEITGTINTVGAGGSSPKEITFFQCRYCGDRKTTDKSKD